jgi:hypothetical protein
MGTTLGTTKPLFFLLEVYYHYLFTTIFAYHMSNSNPSIRLLIQPSRAQPNRGNPADDIVVEPLVSARMQKHILVSLHYQKF